ncbi:MAG: TIGR00730 family Rossman fold protein, partial [Verrucomicrobiae bacterium]|nr:TIGR00730 family Rossman fold protein [Verrucomicrobiae bacterium]
MEPERDFTGGGIFSLPKSPGSCGDKEIDRCVRELVQKWDCGEAAPFVEELIVTSLRIGKDEISEADLKLFNRSLKEMRASSRVFAPYANERKISIFGSARTKPDEIEYQVAQRFAERMKEEGFMTITGAGEGIMGAAQAGAGRDNSFGLNIKLPFEQTANEVIEGDHKLIVYNYFFTRKLAFVKESDAAALFPGGFGTMDEGFEVLTLMQTGKASVFPVVLVDIPGGSYWKTFQQFIKEHLLRLGLISPEDLHLFKVTDDIEEAVEEILTFYSVFHSYRFVRDLIVIRTHREIPPEVVAELNCDFYDIVKGKGEIQASKALPEEANEHAIAD